MPLIVNMHILRTELLTLSCANTHPPECAHNTTFRCSFIHILRSKNPTLYTENTRPHAYSQENTLTLCPVMILSNVNMLRILLLDVSIIILVYRQIFGVEVLKKCIHYTNTWLHADLQNITT